MSKINHMSDAWIFVSIGDAGGCRGWVALDELLFAADSTNHDVPDADDIGAAVSNLVAAGLVETSNSDTKLTKAGCAAYREANKRKVGHIQRFIELADEWKIQAFPPVAPRVFTIDAETYEQAVREYHDEFARISGMPLWKLLVMRRPRKNRDDRSRDIQRR